VNVPRAPRSDASHRAHMPAEPHVLVVTLLADLRRLHMPRARRASTRRRREGSCVTHVESRVLPGGHRHRDAAAGSVDPSVNASRVRLIVGWRRAARHGPIANGNTTIVADCA